ncbi:MAG: cupin domain-containing protein [Phycisphaerales bacterium JB043]
MSEIRCWSLHECYGALPGAWQPARVGEVNDHELKIARLEGAFDWHSHDDTDECFLVLDGEMVMHFRDRGVAMRAGDLLVVPRGVEHRPESAGVCHVLLFERTGTLNTGDVRSERTSENVPDISALLPGRLDA